MLVEYTGVMTPVTYEHIKAHKGLYVITAQAIDDESQVTFFLSLVQKPPRNFRFRPNVIKIKTGGQKISLRWNLRYAQLSIVCSSLQTSQANVSFIVYSHEDFHLMKYSLVISMSKVYLTLCEAEGRLKNQQTWNSTLNYSEDDLPPDDRLEVKLNDC